MGIFDAVLKAPVPQSVASLYDLAFSTKPNAAIACPEPASVQLPSSIAKLDTPNYSLSPNDLLEKAEAAAASLDSLDKSSGFGPRFGVCLVFRTALIGFPDLLYIETMLGEANATSRIALYSHSVYGYSDLGTNRKRLHAILQALSDFAV
ncbi:MAG: DUF1499 domain-containing protein [Sphingomonadales bacterium]